MDRRGVVLFSSSCGSTAGPSRAMKVVYRSLSLSSPWRIQDLLAYTMNPTAAKRGPVVRGQWSKCVGFGRTNRANGRIARDDTMVHGHRLVRERSRRVHRFHHERRQQKNFLYAFSHDVWPLQGPTIRLISPPPFPPLVDLLVNNDGP